MKELTWLRSSQLNSTLTKRKLNSILTRKPCFNGLIFFHRIGNIHRETDPTQWRHIAGIYNPADACSRGIDPTDVDSPVAFHQGPAFLPQLQDPTTWPKWEPTSQENLQEPTCCAVTELDTENNCVDRLVNRISSKVRLERTMAWCLSFVHNSRHKKKDWRLNAGRDGCRPDGIH